jgi:hypothetical protein
LVPQAYTEGPMSLNWKEIIRDFARQPDFYADTDAETGESKPVGWASLASECGDGEGVGGWGPGVGGGGGCVCAPINPLGRVLPLLAQ